MADTACTGSVNGRCVFVEKLTWKGATSEMMTNGMGPNPMANDLQDDVNFAQKPG
jgi:hypothetical protein